MKQAVEEKPKGAVVTDPEAVALARIAKALQAEQTEKVNGLDPRD